MILCDNNRLHVIFQRDFIDIFNGTRSLSRYMSLKGIETIAIYQDRSPSLITSLVAAYNTGITYIPLDPDHLRERINSILEEAQPVLILTQKHLFDQLPDTERKVDVDEIIKNAFDEDFSPVSVNSEDPAYIIFTSGSTGKPKGDMIPPRAVDNFLDSMVKNPV